MRSCDQLKFLECPQMAQSTPEKVYVLKIVMLCIDVPLHCLLQNQVKINKYLVILIVFP